MARKAWEDQRVDASAALFRQSREVTLKLNFAATISFLIAVLGPLFVAIYFSWSPHRANSYWMQGCLCALVLAVVLRFGHLARRVCCDSDASHP